MSMHSTLRGRTAVLAAIAAVTLALSGCNDTSPAESPGVDQEQEQDDNGGY